MPQHPAARYTRNAMVLALATSFGAASAQEAPAELAAAEAVTEAPIDTIAVGTPTEPATLPPAPEGEQVQRIDDIVVTATKRQKSLRDIPESISAISGEKLEDSGRINLVDYIAEVPGLTVTQAYPGLTRFTIRGISTETAPGSAVPSPVGFFIGDTAFTDPYLANIIPDLSAFDLSGVQVLKGPQGTLFGGAALSGAIRYELQEPVQGQWQVRGFTQAVRPDEGSLAITSGIAANVPLWPTQNLAVRFGYVRRNYPGTIDDLRSGQKDIDEGGGDQVRAILLWEPGDWRFKLTHLSQDFAAPNAVFQGDNEHGPRETSQLVRVSPAQNEFGLDSFELGYEFDSFKLVALTSMLYKHASSLTDATNALVGPPLPGYPTQLAAMSHVFENADAFSQEVRLQSTGDGPFEWLAGAYYYSYVMDFGLSIDTPLTETLLGNQSLLMQLAARLGLPADTLARDLMLIDGTSHTTSSEKALFADFSYKLFESLELSAGARFYETSVDGGFLGYGLLVRAENNAMNADSRARIAERGINPKFTATWKFAPGKSVYAQVAKGYRFGGVQITPSTATNGVPPTFKSDTLWNHELGLRTSWLDRTLNADLTAFYIRYKDPIIAQNTQGIPLGYNDNVSGAVSSGLEASILWYTPLSGLSLALKGALTDAHITAPFTASSGDEIQPGQEMPGSAPEQYNASLQYLRPIGAYGFGFNTGYNYVGQGYNDIQHSIAINGYGSWDAGLVLSADNWEFHPKLALNFSNILDEAVPSSGTVVKPLVPAAAAYNTYGLIPPRTVTIRLSFDL